MPNRIEILGLRIVWIYVFKTHLEQSKPETGTNKIGARQVRTSKVETTHVLLGKIESRERASFVFLRGPITDKPKILKAFCPI